MSDTKPKFPYVEFKKIKKIGKKDEKGIEKIEEQPETWYLNIAGTHNQIPCIQNYVNKGCKVIGYGNLESKDPRKFLDVKNYVNGITGKNVDKRLLVDDEPEHALEQKVANERQTKRA